LIRALRKIHTEHLNVLRSLSESILARVEIGASSLSDQQQVDLSVARLEDMLAGMDQEEASAQAQLRASVGRRGTDALPTDERPLDARLPAEAEDTLENAALQHPLLQSLDHRAVAHEQTARALRAEALPSLSVGADWIITGQATMPDVPGSGKDAVIVGGGLSLPLWGSYGENANAEQAEARATRSERIAYENRSLSELRTALAQVRDAVRRVDTYEHTLVPQAESAYSSVLGSYVTGRGTVAQALLAQRDLLDIRAELQRARADYSTAWARLEQVVGRAVEVSNADQD
jgi:outer membrane protein TolC